MIKAERAEGPSVIGGDDAGQSFGASADVNSEDMRLFEMELYKPEENNESLANKVIDRFGEMSAGLNDKRQDYHDKLLRFSKSTKTEDMLAAVRAMSSYHLEIAMVSKVASKATSAIERVTNLQ